MIDLDKNCGVCVHSNEADGRFCEQPDVVARAASTSIKSIEGVEVYLARSSSASPCGPSGRLWQPCQCLEPYCVRHGKDRRR